MEAKRILLVEDDALLQKLYFDLLKEEKFNVEGVTDGETAFTKMKEGGYDLVLLDIMLPNITGIDIMNKLKSDPPLKSNNKVVFLTNMDKSKDLDEAMKMGNEYLVKSNLTPDQFLNKVKSFL